MPTVDSAARSIDRPLASHLSRLVMFFWMPPAPNLKKKSPIKKEEMKVTSHRAMSHLARDKGHGGKKGSRKQTSFHTDQTLRKKDRSKRARDPSEKRNGQRQLKCNSIPRSTTDTVCVPILSSSCCLLSPLPYWGNDSQSRDGICLYLFLLPLPLCS